MSDALLLVYRGCLMVAPFFCGNRFFFFFFCFVVVCAFPWCVKGVLWLRPFLMNSVFVVRALPLVDGSLFLCLLFLFMPGGRPFRSLIYIYIYI